MKRSGKKLRLNTEKAARLLVLGLDSTADTQTTDPDDHRGQRLLDQLRSKLPLDPILEKSLPAMVQSLAEELKSLSGSPVGALLLDPQTKLALLRRIKDHAKQLGACAKSEADREVMLAVYYAAIAAALVHHGAKISEHPNSSLSASFRELVRKTWIPPSLAGLFERAQARCKEKG